MRAASFSAPGKLMLFGEYAVLEGHPAVALCFDSRIRCTATAGGDSLLFSAPSLLDRVLEVRDVGVEPPDPALRLLWPLIQEVMPQLGGLTLEFEAEFPHTWGLGSSSASSLAAVAAIRTLQGHTVEPPALFDEVRGLHRRLQGAASGYDAATQLVGGAVYFDPTGLPSGRPSSATFERIEVPHYAWVVAWTGVKASTGAMIRTVREQHPIGSPIYARIGALAVRGVELLAKGDRGALGAAMNEGHALLHELGAVPADLHARLLALQADPWVHGARMSGAGGGDCVLILARDLAGASTAARAQGFEILPLFFEETGLRAEPLETT